MHNNTLPIHVVISLNTRSGRWNHEKDHSRNVPACACLVCIAEHSVLTIEVCVVCQRSKPVSSYARI